ncbi:MAG: hypothetical protein VR65_12480 [Desulfobulbaceae bacterium BRH_c16a]|nr:MAG: hypothetical protein VR65_12480 [Desulfobulbaceae bacterium BRH_c16a]
MAASSISRNSWWSQPGDIAELRSLPAQTKLMPLRYRMELSRLFPHERWRKITPAPRENLFKEGEK